MKIVASFEFGHHKGLGWIPGKIKEINSNNKLKIPHVGWNSIKPIGKNFLSKFSNQDFYFVHSYIFECQKEFIISTTSYGKSFASAVQKSNVFGVQFHPEKSSKLSYEFFNELKSCLLSHA